MEPSNPVPITPFQKEVALYLQSASIPFIRFSDGFRLKKTLGGDSYYENAPESTKAMSLWKLDRPQFMLNMTRFWVESDVSYDSDFFSMNFRQMSSMICAFENSFQRVPLVICQPKIIVEIDTVDRYLADLAVEPKDVPIVTQDYTTWKTNYSAFVTRLPTMLEVVSQMPEGDIYAPGDGIGVCALAGYLLGRKVLSSEPNAIGDRAFSLGISQKLTFSEAELLIPDGALVIISNLALFVNFSQLLTRVRAVVLDEQIYYPGASKLDVVPYTGDKLRINFKHQFKIKTITPELVPSFDKILTELNYTPMDSRSKYHLEQSGKQSSDNAPLVAYNFKGVTDEDTFLLSYRKFAGAPNGKRGDYRFNGVNWFKYNEQQYFEDTRKGFRIHNDRPYRDRSVMDLDFQFSTETSEISSRFDPSLIRFVRYLNFKFRVQVTGVRYDKVKLLYYFTLIRCRDI